jgi:hypothetical protein
MPQLERASDDDRLMGLVDAALAQPPGEREAWLRRECGGDSKLFDQARDYIESEERMRGFLLEPFDPARRERRKIATRSLSVLPSDPDTSDAAGQSHRAIMLQHGFFLRSSFGEIVNL